MILEVARDLLLWPVPLLGDGIDIVVIVTLGRKHGFLLSGYTSLCSFGIPAEPWLNPSSNIIFSQTELRILQCEADIMSRRGLDTGFINLLLHSVSNNCWTVVASLAILSVSLRFNSYGLVAHSASSFPQAAYPPLRKVSSLLHPDLLMMAEEHTRLPYRRQYLKCLSYEVTR